LSDWETTGNVFDDSEWVTESVPEPQAAQPKKRGFVEEIRQEMLVDRAEVDKVTGRKTAPEKRTGGDRFWDSARESAFSSPIGMEGIYRIVQRIKGKSPEQINATERAILDYYGKKRKTDPNDDWVDTGIDLGGAMLGSIDPTWGVSAGKTLATKALTQGALNAGVDALGQGAAIERGVRDEYSAKQTAINAAAGAGFEAAAHGIGKAVTGHRIRRGSKMPGWQEVNDVIVRDLEGGGTLENPKVSPKGAMGPQQVMPETARDPGFGIRPWDGKSQADLARVGRQYSAAMMNKYDGDVEKVLAAYNAGPGRVDGLIKEFGPDWKDHLPDETKAYVQKGTQKLGGEGVPPMDPAMMRRAMGDTEAHIDEGTLDIPGIDADVPTGQRAFEEGPGLSLLDAETKQPPEFLYRVMSREEYDLAQKTGVLTSREGRVHASANPLFQHAEPGSDNVLVRIRGAEGFRPKWSQDELFAVADQVPFERVELVGQGSRADIETPRDVADLDDVRIQKGLDEEQAEHTRTFQSLIDHEYKRWTAIDNGYHDASLLPGIKARYDEIAATLRDFGDELSPENQKLARELLAALDGTSTRMGGPKLGAEPSVTAAGFRSDSPPLRAANDADGAEPPQGPPQGPSGPDEPPGPPDGPSGRDPNDEWAQSVNLNRLDISDRAKAHIKSLADRTPAHGVEGHSETYDAAMRLIDEHGVEGVLSMDANLDQLPANAVAVRSILESASENIAKMADTILDPSRATPLASHKFEHALLIAASAFERANKNANVAGRLLQSFRIMSDTGDRNAFAAVRREMGADADVFAIAKKIKEFEAKAAQIAADGFQPGALDKFSSLWYNWKLSGLTTQAANLVGTLAHFGLDMSSRMAGVGVGALRRGDNRAHMGEVWARVVGLYSGLKQAFREVEVDGQMVRPIGEAWKIGMPLDFVSKTRTGRAFTGPASAFLEAPTRGMAAIDEVMRNIAVVSDMNGQAWRIARDEGLEGDAFKSRVLELIENPTRAMERSATEYGKRMRFADDATALTKRLEQARRVSKDDGVGDQVLALFSRMVVPFMHTLDRLTASAVSHSPLGFVNRRNNQDLIKGGADADLALGRMIVGTTLVAYAAMKALSGDLTGAESHDFREIEANRAEGKGPYNVRIGDRWASIKQLQPISTLLGATASVVETYKKTKDEDSAMTQFFDISRKMGDAVLSGAWTESLNNFFGGSRSSPESKWANWVSGALDPMPSIGRQTWQTFGDHAERDTTGDRSFEDRVLNRWKASTPLSKGLPQKHDIYGRPLDRGDSIGPDIASPLRAHDVDNDPVVRAISELNKATGKVTIGRVRRTEGMSSEEFQALQADTGARFMAMMHEVIERPGWPGMSVDMKVKLTKKTWSRASKAARNNAENEWETTGVAESDWVTNE
jgi:hypothetical protein